MFELQELLEKTGLKPSRMAEEIGVSRQTFYNLRCDNVSIDIVTLYKVFKFHEKHGATNKKLLEMLENEVKKIEENKRKWITLKKN